MRVISGKYKGKRLDGFDYNGTRPTMDRVKESLFGIIQSYISKGVVLDLFAGSGSLGIEALSNGAKEAYFVDKNIELINVIKKNTVGMNSINIFNTDYKEALNYFKNNNIRFDIIFLDPPYKLNLIGDTIKLILKNNLLNTGGIIVCEYEEENVDTEMLHLLKFKKYGNKSIKIYINQI